MSQEKVKPFAGFDNFCTEIAQIGKIPEAGSKKFMEDVILRFAAKLILSLFILAGGAAGALGQSAPLSERMTATVMNIWKDSVAADTSRPAKWTYEQGVLLKGVEGVWLNTGDGRYFNYIKHVIDPLIADDGTIRT